MLAVLGLTAQEEAVYRLMLGRTSVGPAELATTAAMSERQVAQALTGLIGRGLITATALDTYAAAPPAVALGSLISERREELRTAEVALATFAEEHRAASAGRTIGDLIEVIVGVDALRQRFLQVQHAASGQLRMFVTAPFVAVPPGENTAEHAAIDRGVAVRVVLDRDAVCGPGMTAEVVDSLRYGVQIRVAPALPMKLVLADADLGLVPLAIQAGAEPGAVLLQRSGLLAALDALFETTWRQAYPLELSKLDPEAVVEVSQEEPTELDRKVLGLLMAGLTDQAVATQLDLSLRTLQRRLRYLMDLAGAESRLQLGWHAARNGWC
jgi:DNA-binding NarL/FixJ family response regulator